MTDARLMRGDCMELMKTIPDATMDLILTDPPYFKVKDEQWDNQWSRPEAFLAWLDSVLIEFRRILRPSGSLYLFASPQMAAQVECLVASRFRVLNSIRWAKPKFATKAEMFRKSDLRAFFPNWEAVIFAEQNGEFGLAGEITRLRQSAGLSRAELARRLAVDSRLVRKWEETAQFGQRSTITFSQWLSLHSVCLGGSRNEINSAVATHAAERFDLFVRQFSVTDDVPYTDTWHFDTVKPYPGKHPCEKPSAMLEHIINASTHPGAVVFDAFSGTGSTGIACVSTGRRFIGMEQESKYFDIAVERIGCDLRLGDDYAERTGA